uniref:Uncharacterized protein n=1 Tax=Desulfatirhabdium butyrativorans TaxID=340467 RepID=A0A7C4MME9_9BACT
MKHTRKMMAAVAAVYAYIRSEEDAAAIEAGIPVAAQQPAGQPVAQKHWGLSGRLDIMQWRGLMQMRTFRSHGVR